MKELPESMEWCMASHGKTLQNKQTILKDKINIELYRYFIFYTSTIKVACLNKFWSKSIYILPDDQK